MLYWIFLLFYGYFYPFFFNGNFADIGFVDELYKLLNLFNVHV